MTLGVFSERSTALLSGVSANGITGSAFDMRGTRGTFYRYAGGSAGAAPAVLTAGASGMYQLQMSHDLTAWLPLENVTATAGGQYSAVFSAGVYPYVRAIMTTAWSAAQTGTGVIYVSVFAAIE